MTAWGYPSGKGSTSALTAFISASQAKTAKWQDFLNSNDVQSVAAVRGKGRGRITTSSFFGEDEGKDLDLMEPTNFGKKKGGGMLPECKECLNDSKEDCRSGCEGDGKKQKKKKCVRACLKEKCQEKCPGKKEW
eukprot:CAMPEP_0197653884 /NCGR_PEP_ID=MMETSP1338-20131121/37541_1 /TAXON_ID=43686 ORGANISM="Pelagodinium beii, Strain RCC1491" /NCGR_SAMPLE_ID=MMETSP1338 /ASSEMBLY_ACC=CAM_ASM_000754 /LENGTH=133 /DNA_ID=CAMNT_0043229165 /DNA_START=90 /DNA_END=488 /DNA_ORIENTATION=+